jgi:cytidine deaminase
MQTIALSEILIPDHVTETPLGKITVPGMKIPARLAVVDPALVKKLIDAARLATEGAYHNYTTKPFAVGAACIMADDGESEIFSAANSEMSVLNAGICAERALLNYVVSKGFRRIKMIAISTAHNAKEINLRAPCGLCRQTIAEFADENTLIVIDHNVPGKLADIVDIVRLLPFAYRYE